MPQENGSPDEGKTLYQDPGTNMDYWHNACALQNQLLRVTSRFYTIISHLRKRVSFGPFPKNKVSAKRDHETLRPVMWVRVCHLASRLLGIETFPKILSLGVSLKNIGKKSRYWSQKIWPRKKVSVSVSKISVLKKVSVSITLVSQSQYRSRWKFWSRHSVMWILPCFWASWSDLCVCVLWWSLLSPVFVFEPCPCTLSFVESEWLTTKTQSDNSRRSWMCFVLTKLGSIAVSVFPDILVELTNTVSVVEAKIPIPLLIVRQGALSPITSFSIWNRLAKRKVKETI